MTGSKLPTVARARHILHYFPLALEVWCDWETYTREVALAVAEGLSLLSIAVGLSLRSHPQPLDALGIR